MGNSIAAEPAVLAAGLTVRRGKRTVLDRVDLEVAPGRVTGLLGPSGCGKSTLMRSVVGVQAKVSGRLSVLGEPAGSASLRRRVAYATQAASVYDDLTVRQNLAYFSRVLGARFTSAEASPAHAPRGRTAARARDDADRVIELVGLQDRAAHRVDALSGGERNRVSLAAALLGSPELIVLDEPTVGLDPVLRAELWELFHSLAEGGATLLVSSHVMDEALRCDRLLLMREGRIIADTTPAELLTGTGTDDPEGAFLALIARDAGGGGDAGDDGTGDGGDDDAGMGSGSAGNGSAADRAGGDRGDADGGASTLQTTHHGRHEAEPRPRHEPRDAEEDPR